MFAASVVPFLLAYVATTGHRFEPVYFSFWSEFRNTLGGTPFYLAGLAVVLFQIYAVIRRVPAAWDLLWVSLACLSAIEPSSLDFDEIVAPRPLPLAAAGLVMGSLAWQRRHTFQALVAGTALAIAVGRGCAIIWPHVDSILIAVQLIIIVLMAVGAVCARRSGSVARSSGCFGLLALELLAALGYPPMVVSLTPSVVPFYVAATTVAALAYGLHLRDRRYVAVAAAGLAAWLAHSGTPELQAASPLFDRSRSDRLRASVLHRRRGDQPEEGRNMAAISAEVPGLALQAMMSFTTVPCTSVRRKSRPA